MRVAYGITLVEDDDKYFNMAERILGDTDKISTPGRFLVEVIPSLRHVPSWFPGAGFKTFAAEARAFMQMALNELHNAAMDGLVGTPHPILGKCSNVSPICIENWH